MSYSLGMNVKAGLRMDSFKDSEAWRKGWIRKGYEPEYNDGGCPIAGIYVNFENEDFGYQIRFSAHGAGAFSPEPKLEPKQ